MTMPVTSNIPVKYAYNQAKQPMRFVDRMSSDIKKAENNVKSGTKLALVGTLAGVGTFLAKKYLKSNSAFAKAAAAIAIPASIISSFIIYKQGRDNGKIEQEYKDKSAMAQIVVE